MRTEQMPKFVRYVLGAALCLLPACPGKLDDKQGFLAYAAEHGDGDAGAGPDVMNTAGTAGTSPATGACGDVVTRIFIPSCGGNGCHSATAPQQGLDLASPDVARRVVGVSGKMCLVTLADPSQPEGSLLYQKLATKPPCGAQMPLARPPLSAADAACVLEWIAAQSP